MTRAVLRRPRPTLALRFGFGPRAGAAVALTSLLFAGAAWAEDKGPERPELAPETAERAPIPRETALFRLAFEGRGGRPAGQLQRAMSLASPLQTDVLTWSRLALRDEGDFDELSAFLARRPGWPSEDALRARAEELAPETIDRADVLRFFADHAPQTARGARLYGEALIAAGRWADGEKRIIDAWRALPAAPAEEELFLSKHGALLKAHHAERLETMLWRDRLNAARRAAKRVGSEALAWAETWIALVRGRGNVDRMLNRLPKDRVEHPGTALARIRWRKRKGLHDSAEDLLRQVSSASALPEPAAWADMRLYFSREAYEAGRYDDAYEVSGPHGLERGFDYSRLEWFAGWMALRKLDQPDRALSRFERMFASVTRPISRARAAYWAGEAAAAAGDAPKAERWREKAAAHPNTYYGQLAALRLGRGLATPDRPVPTAERGALPSADRDLIGAAELLYRAQEIRAARRFLKLLAERRPDEPHLRLLASVARANGDPGGEIAVADVGQEPDQKLWPELYPIPAYPSFTGRSTEAALLLAIARQESRFTPDALSSAGARGLMQLMPRTARTTARRARIRFDRGRLSSSPDYNLEIADAHLQELLRDYGGSYLLTAAAYNAGGGNVSAWIRRFGDPRDPDVDAVDWIESIPFSETRNYAQRVLEAVQVYRARLDGGQVALRAPDAITR
ncbi:MAG: lytic transglycosylase domain-containing protein [Pseudomonadota bacterium]